MAEVKDILDFNSGDLARPTDLFEGHCGAEPLIWINSNRFLLHIISFTNVDILTYTHKSIPNQRRVICALGTRIKQPKYEIRTISNLHTKLYICHKGRNKEIYLGSQNCTPSFTHNIMMQVDKKLHSFFVDYFEHLWKEAK